MNNNSENPTDALFHTHFAWLEEYFKPHNKDMYEFTDQDQQTIFDVLSQHWKEPNIIDRFNDLYKEYGDKFTEFLEIIVASNMRQLWSAFSQVEESHNIDDLIRLLWEPLRDKLEFTVEKLNNGVQVYCTSCSFADVGKKINGAKWIRCLVCNGDPHIVEAFNPQIGLRVTKTLMQGDDCCDHFYFLKDE